MKKHEKIIESYKNQLLAYRYPSDYQSNPKCREITPEMIEILIKHKYNNYKPTQNELKTYFGSNTTFYHVKTAFRDLTAEEDIFGLNPLCDEGLIQKNKELESKIKELNQEIKLLKTKLQKIETIINIK